MNIRIAFIHDIYPFGGGEKVTSDISPWLNAQGHQTYVFTGDLRKEKIKEDDSDIIFFRLPFKRINEKSNCDFICDKINKENISLLIVPGIYPKWLKEIKNRTGCKIVFVLHNVPFWEVTNSHYNNKRKSRLSLGGYLKWIVVKKPLNKIFSFDEKKVKASYLRYFDICDGFALLSEGYKRHFAWKTGLKYNDKKLYVLTNPAITAETGGESEEKEKLVIYSGRLSYAGKRIDRLLRIWNKVSPDNPEWNLKIIGEGPEYVNLKEMAEEMALENITFEGYKSDLSEYYRKASILCLTSTFEGWPMELIEAQANRIAAIAFDCTDGVNQILSPHLENGILASGFDEDDYACRLSELMNDDSLRLRLMENGPKAAKRFSLENSGAEWETMIAKLFLQ